MNLNFRRTFGYYGMDMDHLTYNMCRFADRVMTQYNIQLYVRVWES